MVALLRILYNFVILYFGLQEAEKSGLWADGEPSYKRDDYHRLRTDLTSLARKHPDILQGLQQPFDEAYFLKLGSTGNYEDLQVCSRSNRIKTNCSELSASTGGVSERQLVMVLFISPPWQPVHFARTQIYIKKKNCRGFHYRNLLKYTIHLVSHDVFS